MTFAMQAQLEEKLFKNDAFRKLSKKVSPDSHIYPHEYYMRYDGTLVFVVAVLSDEKGMYICGNPVRVPCCLAGEKYIQNIFGINYLNLMKYLDTNGISNSQQLQLEQLDRIIEAQKGTEYEIGPFNRVSHFNGKIFRKEELKYIFPTEKTLEFVMEKNLPEVKEAVFWAEKELGISKDKLGITGSTSLGIIEAGEDVDLVMKDNSKELIKYRNTIKDFIEKLPEKRAVFEFGKKWPLRAWLTEKTELCPFFVVADEKESLFYGAEVNIEHSVQNIRSKVVDDKYNMLCPTTLKLSDNESGDNIDLFILTSFYRGDFWDGQEIEIKKAYKANIRTKDGNEQKFYLVKDWNAIKKL